MNEGSSGEYVVKAIASATLDKTRIKPSNSKVRFFKKFVTLSKKFVFITNRLRTFYHFYESVKNFNMIKQRICIVGEGLSGLMTAVVLSKVSGIEVNLIAKKGTKNEEKNSKNRDFPGDLHLFATDSCPSKRRWGGPSNILSKK